MIEDTEKIITCVTAIVGLITAIITIFSEYKGIVNKKNREDQYYKNLLKPFVKEYTKNKDINVLDFVKKKVERNDDNIPQYIYYLLEKKDSRLYKVLIYDYSNLYQNEENRMSKMLRNISRFLYYLLFFLSLVLLFFGAYAIGIDILFIVMKLFQLLFEGFKEFQKDWNYFVKYLVIAFTGLAGCYLTNLAIRELNYDRYTIKKKKIEKLIDSSVKIYDNQNEKIVL